MKSNSERIKKETPEVRERRLKRQREHYLKNKEKYLAKYKAEYYKNLEKSREAAREKRMAETQEQREARLAYLRQYRSKPERKKRAKDLAQSDKYKYVQYQKQSALRRKKIFNLTFEQFVELYHSPCYLCGSKEANGIDRVTNSIGYVYENARACCRVCNMMKWKHDKDIFLAHIEKIARHNNVV